MAASRAFANLSVLMGLKTIGFDRAFSKIRKGSKDSESALQKMAGGLASATEGARSFTKSGVEGALDMSTRLRHLNVVMGGTAEGIEGLRKEQARVRVETGMNAEEADRLRMGLVEIGEKSAEVAVQAAKTSKALQLDPETTVGWFRMGKQMGMLATDTNDMMKQAGGLLTEMGVPPTAFFEQPAEVADLMLTRMIALGEESPAAAKQFIKSAAAMTAMLSKSGAGAEAAASIMREFASGGAEAISGMRDMMAGISGGEIPDLIKSSAILQQDFTAAMNQAAGAPDKMLVALAQMTKEVAVKQPEAFENWAAWVKKTVGNPALAKAILKNSDDVINAQALATGGSEALTAAFERQVEAALKSPKALRDMRDEQLKVLKESIALNEVFKITNPLVELQTKALNFLNTAHDDLGSKAMAVTGRYAIGFTGIIGEGAEKVSDFAIQSANTAKALNEMRKAAPALAKGIAKALPTFTKWGQALTGLVKIAPDVTKTTLTLTGAMTEWGPGVIETTTKVGGLSGAFLKVAGTITGVAVPSFGAALLALGPLLIALVAIAAIFGGLYLAISAYATMQEKAGQAAVDRANKETQAIVQAKKVADDRNDQVLFEAAQMKNLSNRLAELKKERDEFSILRGTIFGPRPANEINREIKQLEGFQARSWERTKGIQATRFGGTASSGGATAAVTQLAGGPTPVETQDPHSPTPVTPSSAFPPGGQMVRVAIQSLEEQRSQVGLLEQLVALMGGLPGAITPPTAGGGGGGGGVNVTIRPDSGRMQLHKMLEVDAKNTMGRAGYTQFGGRINSA